MSLENAEEDRFVSFETLDQSTREFAARETRIFTGNFSARSRQIIDKVRKFSGSKLVFDIKVSGVHRGLLYSQGSSFIVEIDGRIIRKSDKIMLWFEMSPDASRVAVFETEGSDEGDLLLYQNGEFSSKLHGFITGITYFDDTFYLRRHYREEKIPPGIERNSERVLLGDRIVFGDGFRSDDFIDVRDFDGSCIVEVGNWTRSAVYTGKTSDPGSWKKQWSFDVPSSIIGMRNGQAYVLVQSGFGRILRDGDPIAELDQPVLGAMLVEGGILVVTMQDAKASFRLHSDDGKLLRKFELDTPYGLVSYDSDGTTARVCLVSFDTSYVEYEFLHGELMKKAGEKALNASVSEGWTQSDGAKIHYFHITSPFSEKKKAVIYGYGGFNISLTPTFNPVHAALLELGVDVVYCNLRGGGEYGEKWHESGKREKKFNVFSDFESIVSEFVGKGYSVVVQGASNGGLLTSHTLNSIPEKLSGAVIGNPVIDMMHFHRLFSGNYWVNEYGDPDNPEDRKFLSAYSPYHNLENRKYPVSLIYTRLSDDRVHPAHALKFYAKLKETGSETYLRADPSGGHIGLTHDKLVEERSEIAAFILYCLQL